MWIHASSAGETLQARPLGDAIRSSHPGAAIFYTYFSPSAERYAADWGTPDATGYLPIDFPGPTRALVEILAPEAVVFVGAEMWPNLVWTSIDRGARVAQACCRIAPGSGRLKWPARSWIGDLYGRLDAVSAVTEEDAATVVALGARPEVVSVSGDTRVDVTLERLAVSVDSEPVWSPPEGSGPVIVAGSTWPEDERVVVPAVARLREDYPGLVAVVAPHEPTVEALRRLRGRADEKGLGFARLSGSESGAGNGIVAVDRVGILYRLYAEADLAYVGGGFGGSVHNTLEPAVHGVPMAIGPDHGGPAEVGELRESGALIEVTSTEDLAAVWRRWLDDPGRRSLDGAAGREAVERLSGATARTIQFLRSRGFPV